jgi:hypothetical protein
MTGTSTSLQGGCTCGAVRYRMGELPLFVHACHCRWCQRETGTAFAINALLETSELTVQGAPEEVLTPSASGRGQRILRCSTCRVALWSHYSGMGSGVSFVRAGTLDEPDRVSPDIHIFTDSKVPWVVLPDGVAAVPEYYDMKVHWPSRSLARLRAARSA